MQEMPKAERITELSKASCEGYTFQLQDFATAIANRPGSKGIAVFYPQKYKPAGALFFENSFRATIAFLKLDTSVFKMLLAKPGNSTKVEYWIVPSGAKEPEIEVAKSGEIFENVSKPFLYNTEFGGEVCPAANPDQIADIIKWNPNVDLRIAIRGKTEKYRKAKMNKWLTAFVRRRNVPKSRIRVLLTRKLRKDYPYEDVEFWLVPIHRK
jgi:hypothetical protein